MKIGILTFHRASNYGAVLQCYALQEVLKKIGHSVYIIDYKQPFITALYRPFHWRMIINGFRRPAELYNDILSFPQKFKQCKNFNTFIKRNLNIYNGDNSKLDAFIIGSDQLWGKHCLGGSFDNVYMGEIPGKTNQHVFSYAISINEDSILALSKKEIDIINTNFKIVSVRERDSAVSLKKILKSEVRVDLDPTLVADKNIWDKLIKKKWSRKKYVLYYNLRKVNGNDEQIISKIKNYATSEGLDFIDLSTIKYSVNDFVSLHKYAQCVFTTSFHSTIFSLIYERSMTYIKLNDGHDGRSVGLLKNIGANNMISDIDFMPQIIDANYENIKNRLDCIRIMSLKYLKQI